MTLPFRFPDGFAFGVATAAYQIEGAWNLDGRGESIWDRFAHEKGNIIDGTSGDRACDHYHRYAEDVRLMQSLGIKHYRFSISWPRVLPAGRGKVNRKGLDFYERLIETLLEAGIEPYPTLYHWDLPQSLQDLGGWQNRTVAEYFGEYAGLLAATLSDRVKYWTSINEPWVIANLGHKTGEMAPGLKDEKISLQVAHNLLLAHGRAVQAVRSVRSSNRLGIVLILFPADGHMQIRSDQEAAEFAWQKECAWYLDPLLKGKYPEQIWQYYADMQPSVQSEDFSLISQKLDFLGINYYFRQLISAKSGRILEIPGARYTDMGWEVRASSLKDLLLRVSSEYPNLPPLFITENGAAYKDFLTEDGRIDDQERIVFIEEHLKEAHAAIKAGVDLRAYFLWSLLDNFEWAYGLSKRFGIVYVDYENEEKRYLKNSAHFYARVIERNGLA